MSVLLDDNSQTGKTGTVIVPDRQLSLAIGKEGQNARLAAKLTGWRIDIKSASEAAEETLGKLEDIEIPPDEMDLLSLAEALLRKRDMDDLSEEEKSLLAAGLEEGAEGDLAWPEEEPKAEAEPVPEDEVAEDQVEAVQDEAVAVEAAEVEVADIGEEIEEPDEGELDELLESDQDSLDEADLMPSFEGEPIEDCWIQTSCGNKRACRWRQPKRRRREGVSHPMAWKTRRCLIGAGAGPHAGDRIA
jgi:N utilization substance protein A